MLMPLGADISSDLALKGLEADARNALTNVAHGDTLSPAKRQMLLAAVITEAKPEEFTQARIYAILLRYTEGRRLTKDELAEIAHLLPQEHAAYSKTLTVGKHLKPYKDYESVYGKKERTIKWWVTQGKAAPGGPDLPPLDQPPQMPLWWERVMKQSCPPSVKHAALSAAGASSSPRVNAPPAVAAAPLSSSTASPRFENPVVLTQEQDLVRLQEMRDRAFVELLEVQEEPDKDESKIKAKQSRWLDLRSQVEKATENLFKLRSKQKGMVDQEQLGSKMLPILVTIANSIRSLRTRVKPKLATARTEDEEEKIWQDGIDDCFAEMIADGFISRERLALAA